MEMDADGTSRLAPKGVRDRVIMHGEDPRPATPLNHSERAEPDDRKGPA
jgi:hypothetical protein